MDPKEIRNQLAAKMSEAKALAAPFAGKDADMPKETADKIAAAMGQYDELKARLDLATRMAAEDAYLNEPQDLKAGHIGWRNTAPGEGDTPVDPMAWRSVRVKTAWGDEREFRYHVPLCVQGKGYPAAYEAFLRKGRENMGPADYKTLSEGVDTAGGFFVPEEALNIITRKVAQMAVIRGMARVMTTSKDLVTWPRVNYATDDIWTSGVRFTWTGETPAAATTHRVTDPVLGRYAVPIHTAMASMPLTNNLLDDSAFDVMGIGAELIGEAYALGEDNVFINGTGVNQPMGVLGEAEANGPAAVHLGSVTQPTQAGLVNLEAALPAQYERNAVFFGSKATYAQIRQANQTTSGQLLWGSSLAEGYLQPMQPTLLGYPVRKSEFVPAIATTTYSLILGDWTGYYIFNRAGLSIARNASIYQETDITMLIAKKRVGAYCVEPFRFQLGQMSV